jgi:hypothetical protein
MAVTYYVALPFIRTDDGTAPGEAQECHSEAAAIRRAEGMSRDPANAGAVAFKRAGDPNVGEFSDAVVLKKFGHLRGLHAFQQISLAARATLWRGPRARCRLMRGREIIASMNCSFFFFVVLMRKMIKPIGQGSSMIGPNCTQNDIQPSFSQNARSFITARSHDNGLLLWIIFLVSCKLRHYPNLLRAAAPRARWVLDLQLVRRPTAAVRRPEPIGRESHHNNTKPPRPRLAKSFGSYQPW